MNTYPSILISFLTATVAQSFASDARSAPTELETLRSDVTNLASPYLVSGADVRVKIAQALFTRITDVISNFPPEKRRASFDGTSATGYIWSQGGGLAGCGGFAEINSGGKDLHFTVDISGLGATWQSDGRMAVKLNAGFNGWGTVHGHVKGPAGLCEGPSIKYPLGRWSCDCPIGGGAGTVVGIQMNKGSAFEGNLTLTPQGDGQIGYAVVLTSPTTISVTVSASLQQIGNIGFPISFSLPTTPLLQGRIVGIIKNQGVVKVGDAERPYVLAVTNMRVLPDASGLEMLADAKVSPASNK